MTKKELLIFKLNQLSRGGRMDTGALVQFILSLMEDPDTILQNIIDEVKVENTKALAQIEVTKARLQASAQIIQDASVSTLKV